MAIQVAQPPNRHYQSSLENITAPLDQPVAFEPPSAEARVIGMNVTIRRMMPLRGTRSTRTARRTGYFLLASPVVALRTGDGCDW
jgi:hypothetical protein